MKSWKKKISDLWYNITYPFVAVYVLYAESKQQNLDGSWDKYHARRNARAERREKRREVK